MQDDVKGNLKRLLTGLVDQEIKGGKEFQYDGSKMHADEVADLMLPSVLCIAQDVSIRLGLGGFGFTFSIGETPGGTFPMILEDSGECKRFFEIAPLLTEVFDGEVMDCRLDLARLFESAAKLINKDFSLDEHSNYLNLNG